MEDELSTTNAVNGMRVGRFGGAINYAVRSTPKQPAPQPMIQEDETPPVTQHYEAAPVQAPAPDISTTMPQVPDVQPTEPVQPSLAATPTTAQTTAQTDAQTQPKAPVQQIPKPMPARPGVTANPMTDPYAYFEQMYGPSETLEERQARERREYKNQQISNWLGTLGALGNMVVTSSSRYGRAVKSPDIAQAAANGIMTQAAKRREEDRSRLAAVQKQQQLDAQREKMKRDADERAWNHAYKVKKDEADDRWRREKDERDDAYRREQLDYQKQRDSDRLNFDKTKEKERRAIEYAKLADQRKERRQNIEIEAMKFAAEQARYEREHSSKDEIVLPHPSYPNGLHIAKSVWNDATKNVVISMLYNEAEKQRKEEFKKWKEHEEATNWKYRHFGRGFEKTPRPKNWFDEFAGDINNLDYRSPDAEYLIVSYLSTHPDSEASKNVVNMLQSMSNYNTNDTHHESTFWDDDDPLKE